jgi:hypothetical protein
MATDRVWATESRDCARGRMRARPERKKILVSVPSPRRPEKILAVRALPVSSLSQEKTCQAQARCSAPCC